MDFYQQEEFEDDAYRQRQIMPYWFWWPFFPGPWFFPRPPHPPRPPHHPGPRPPHQPGPRPPRPMPRDDSMYL